MTEHPDPTAAARGGSGQERPGFALGGAKGGDNATGVGSRTSPGGRRSSPGTTPGLGDGATDTSGSRSSGNRGDAGSGPGSGPTDGSGGPN